MGINAGLLFPHSRNMMDITIDDGELRKCFCRVLGGGRKKIWIYN